MDKWKELIHRALLECQKIEQRQNNTKMLRIDDVISKMNDFLKYRNDNGEFNEICEANSNGTKVSTFLTKELLAALFAENIYICVEGKSQNLTWTVQAGRWNFRAFFEFHQGEIPPSPRTTPTPTKDRTLDAEYVTPNSMPKRKQKVEPKVEPSFEPKFEETESEHISDAEEPYQHSSEVPELIRKQNIGNAKFESDEVIRARKDVKRWLFSLVRHFVKDKGSCLFVFLYNTHFRWWNSFAEVG